MSIELRGPTPIFVGISGHRDVRADDLPELGRAVDAFFAQVRERYAHTDIILLTGLASGADQLGAAHARANGIAYIAVLPMPLQAYRKDFSHAAERERFETLLNGAASRIELPLAPNVSEETLHDPELRSHQYGALGAYLVAHSAILLALYNGKPVHARGGTSEVVAAARERRISRRGAVKPFVYEISTPRVSDGTTRRPPFEATEFDHAHPALEALARIDHWNGLAAGRYTFDADLCSQTFDVADRFAIEHQTHTHRAIDRVYLFTLVSTLALQAYDHLGEFVPPMERFAQLCGLFFFAFIAAAIYLVSRIHADEVQSRFQDYRVLAEGLRVQLALLDAGLDIDAATHYHDGGGPDFQWVLRAIDVAYVATAIASCRIPLPPESGSEGRPSWIVDQRAYYERAAARNHVHAARANRIAVRWLRLSVLAGVLVAIDGLLHFSVFEPFGRHLDALSKSATLLVFGLAGSLAAIVKGKSGLRGYAVLASRYQAMFETFDDAYRRIADAVAGGRNDRAAAIFTELAEAALVESAQWHSSERSRPLESMWGG